MKVSFKIAECSLFGAKIKKHELTKDFVLFICFYRYIAQNSCTLSWSIEAQRRPFLHSSEIWHIPNLAPRIAPATAAFVSASPPDKTIFRDAQHHVGIISPVTSLPTTTMIILHDLVLYPIRIETIHLLLGQKLRVQSKGISYSLSKDGTEESFFYSSFSIFFYSYNQQIVKSSISSNSTVPITQLYLVPTLRYHHKIFLL